MAVAYSITASGKVEPFGLQVSRGQIMGHRAVTIFGYNGDVDTSEETIWTGGGILARPATAGALKVSSSSTNDAAAGTGARTIVLNGLDGNYNEISETVTLNGQTAVNTTKSFFRVQNLYVATTGSGLTAAGTIYVGTGTVTSGVPATIYGEIAVGNNASLTAHYTIPAGYTGYFTYGNIGAGQLTGSHQITGRLLTINGTGIRTTAAIVAFGAGVQNFSFAEPLPIPEKHDVEAAAVSSAGNAVISATIQMILIKNDYT